MSWLYERKTYASEKNGTIVCRRLFGRWEIFVDGFHETSRYLAAVWRDAYDRLPKKFVARDVLIFGLAGGDNVALLHERFPGCRVTAVEWDPVMIRIADELGLIPRDRRPRVVPLDAKDAVAVLNGGYDLVLIDLFRGKEIAPVAFSDDFLSAVSRLMAPGGYLIANGFLQQDLFKAVARHLKPGPKWKSQYNRMALFEKPPEKPAKEP